MNKYIGVYRVVAEFCRQSLEPNKEDTYIVCSREGQIYRIDNTYLAYYRPSRGNSEQLTKKLIELGVRGVSNRSTDGDILIHFQEESLDIVAKELGASTNGASINPTSVKNLRKQKWFRERKNEYIEKGLYKELSEEEKEVFRERFKNLVRE